MEVNLQMSDFQKQTLMKWACHQEMKKSVLSCNVEFLNKLCLKFVLVFDQHQHQDFSDGRRTRQLKN
jgi:hypothetical protein